MQDHAGIFAFVNLYGVLRMWFVWFQFQESIAAMETGLVSNHVSVSQYYKRARSIFANKCIHWQGIRSLSIGMNIYIWHIYIYISVAIFNIISTLPKTNMTIENHHV